MIVNAVARCAGQPLYQVLQKLCLLLSFTAILVDQSVPRVELDYSIISTVEEGEVWLISSLYSRSSQLTHSYITSLRGAHCKSLSYCRCAELYRPDLTWLHLRRSELTPATSQHYCFLGHTGETAVLRIHRANSLMLTSHNNTERGTTVKYLTRSAWRQCSSVSSQ